MNHHLASRTPRENEVATTLELDFEEDRTAITDWMTLYAELALEYASLLEDYNQALALILMEDDRG